MNPVPAAIPRGQLAAMQERALRRRRDPRRLREREERRRNVGLWLPVTPFFWLLAPFALLLAPLIALAPPMRGVNPYAAVLTIGQLLVSMSGTKVHVDTPDVRVRLTLL